MTPTRQAALRTPVPRSPEAVERPRILAVIPAFNEEACLEEVVRSLLAQGDDLHVLVVNDGSRDETEAVARNLADRWERVFLLNLPNNIGIGGAVQAGFKFARRRGYDVVVQVDGDGQHPADHLARVAEPVLEGRVDIAVGSRFLHPEGGAGVSSFCRRIGIRFFTALLSLLTRRRMTDPTSGFRAYGRAAVEYLSEHYAEDYPEPEALMILHRRRFRSVEVPVKMHPRLAGRSSISPSRACYYMLKVTVAVVMDLFRPRA